MFRDFVRRFSRTGSGPQARSPLHHGDFTGFDSDAKKAGRQMFVRDIRDLKSVV